MKEDRQGTDNVILRSVLSTTVAVEKNYSLHIPRVCVFVASGIQFEMSISKANIFDRKFTVCKKCVLIFSKTSVCNISHSKKN